MRKIIQTFLLFVLFVNNVQAQITTYFNGQNRLQSGNKLVALHSISIYEDVTKVTVELIPTRNIARMNFWTSSNTYIVIEGGIELPILGFEKNVNGKSVIERGLFYGNWGWDNVRKGERYYYTMVFSGAIPPGVTKFSLQDKGVGGEYGYSFLNYNIDNPRREISSWTEITVKSNVDNNNDGICGIYEATNDLGYTLGCVKQNDEYRLVYLSSKENMSWWQIGDTKAILRPSSTRGLFKARWYMADKTLNDNCYVVFERGSMKIIIGNDETFYIKMYPTSSSPKIEKPIDETWEGTGFALASGYIVTNYHVIENAKSIIIKGVNGDFSNQYHATVVAVDKNNDLAILQIMDEHFKDFGTIPYNVKIGNSDVGEDIFVLGYPLSSTMGDEIKLTTGVISSKTGFQGDVSLYQISAPVQPGNSGGPLFDNNGNLIGIISSKHRGAENVSYAIKSSYLKNLIDSSVSAAILPNNNRIAGLPLTGKVKSLKNFVFMVSCSTKDLDYTTQKFQVRQGVFVEKQNTSSVIIKSVKVTKEFTAIEMIADNEIGEHEYASWCCIKENTYIQADNKQYVMTRAEGIKVDPQVTYFNGAPDSIAFTLYFPPIPEGIKSINLIEPGDGDWKFYGIKIEKENN